MQGGDTFEQRYCSGWPPFLNSPCKPCWSYMPAGHWHWLGLGRLYRSWVARCGSLANDILKRLLHACATGCRRLKELHAIL